MDWQRKQKSIPKGPSILFGLRPVLLGVDDDGDERKTNSIVLAPAGTRLAGKKSNSGSKPAPGTAGPNDREVSVLVALRELTPAARGVGAPAFKAAEVRGRCDPAPFDGCRNNPDNFLKAVSRALDGLTRMAEKPVIKVDGGYRLNDDLVSK